MPSLLNQFQIQDYGVTGCLVQMEGVFSHSLMQQALRVLENIAQEHCASSVLEKEKSSADKNSNDANGVGILCALPRAFFEHIWPFLREKPTLSWGVGQFFMPRAHSLRAKLMDIIEKNINLSGLSMLAVRRVPVDAHVLSAHARQSMPVIMQILICENTTAEKAPHSMEDFEHALYVARRCMEKAIYEFLQYHQHDVRQFHVLSLSARTIVYKGLVNGARLGALYPDLRDPLMAPHFIIYHHRFYVSGTMSWRAVQPMRTLAATGTLPATETLRQRWRLYAPILLPELVNAQNNTQLQRILPVIDTLSGSPLVPAATGAALDNVCEFLLQNGYSLPSAIHCLFPAQQQDVLHDQRFLAGANHAMNVLSTDGSTWIALTHHASHTCRYVLTHDNILIMGAGAALSDMDSRHIKEQARIQPHSTLFVDLANQRIVIDEQQSMHSAAEAHKHTAFPHEGTVTHATGGAHFVHVQQSFFPHFGYTDTVVSRMQGLMQHSSSMPFFMEPLAIFAQHPCFFSYFRGINTQFRSLKSCKISLSCHVRVRQDTLLENAQLPYIMVESVLVTPERLRTLLERVQESAQMMQEHMPVTLDAFFTIPPMEESRQNVELEHLLQKSLDLLRLQAEDAVKSGVSVIIISHASCLQGMDADTIPIPSMLAVASVHSHLLRKDLRHLCTIIAEVADAYAPMHMVQMIHIGADIVCPFMALALVMSELPVHAHTKAADLYAQALTAGMCRIVQNLGVRAITALQSGVFFESLGINTPVLQEHFTGIHPRLGGIHLGHIANEASAKWRLHAQDGVNTAQQHRSKRVYLLKRALEKNGLRPFKDYVRHCHHGAQRHPQGLHHMLRVTRTKPMAASQESVDDILKRFIGVGSPQLNILAQHCLEHIHKSVGAQWCSMPKMHRYEDNMANHDAMRYGRADVTFADKEEMYISFLHEGEHGKYDMACLHDVAALIHALRKLQPHMRICVMLPAGAGVGALAAVLVKAGAHTLWLCGAQHGGQGLLQEDYDHMLPWELALAEVQHVLSVHRLRRRVRLRLLAPLFTGQDVMKAILLGAEEFSIPAPLLVSLGCQMCEQCHDDCPGGMRVGADYNNFRGNVAHGVRFLRYIAEDVAHNVSQLGYEYIDQLIGRADILEKCSAYEHKGSVVDVTSLTQGSSCLLGQRSGMPSYAPLPLTGLEHALIEKLTPRFCHNAEPCHFSGTVRSTDMAVGTHLSGEILRRNLEEKHRTPVTEVYTAKLWGVAGQCLGAFLTKGITVCVYGEANDHVAKGLCGGVVVVTPTPHSSHSHRSVPALIGDAALYGASSGELYVAGSAGDYFAVCNHGASAVVEGVGDNACMHMYGGVVLVLGQCGKDFAQSMQGGSIYIYRPEAHYMDVEMEHAPFLSHVHEEDRRLIIHLLERHVAYTHSPLATKILEQHTDIANDFIKIDAESGARSTDSMHTLWERYCYREA